MYKEELALNYLQWLICHKAQPKPNHLYIIYIFIKRIWYLQWFASKFHTLNIKPNQIKIPLKKLTLSPTFSREIR